MPAVFPQEGVEQGICGITDKDLNMYVKNYKKIASGMKKNHYDFDDIMNEALIEVDVPALEKLFQTNGISEAACQKVYVIYTS